MAEKTEDLNLPLAVVTRIIKDALPDGVNVSKEARIAIARAASVFVLFATTTANTYAVKAKRKTLAASDILQALADMDFEELVEPLQNFLEAKKQESKNKRPKGCKDDDVEIHDELDEVDGLNEHNASAGEISTIGAVKDSDTHNLKAIVQNVHDNPEPKVP